MRKKAGKNAPPPPVPKKRPGSFVWKLTFRQMLRMAGMVAVINLAILLLVCGTVLLQTEEQVIAIYSQVENGETVGLEGAAYSPGVEVVRVPGKPDDAYIPFSLRGNVLSTLAARGIHYAPDWASLWGDWNGFLEYTVAIPVDGEDWHYAAVFDLSKPYLAVARCMSILLAVESLLLLNSIWGVRKSARKTLRPIQQLADMAYSMSVELQPQKDDKIGEKLQLSGTIDTLNTITAKKLDTRIEIQEEREELQGLAGAINSMLDRLDAAYQSQLRFVSDASHELRTPIAVIQGYANLLDRWGKEDPDTLQESIEAIKAETQGMQALVEQLLFLARSDNNSIMLELETLDISQMATEVLRDSQLIDGAHNFHSSIAPGLWVMGDSGLIKQALRIFVDNAIKYTPPGERITVAALREGDWVKVSVTDNGIGIPEEDLPQVFDRFFRSDESRARKTGGTGLGLSIAKWTIHRHGGHLDIVSRQDFGTKLTMVLPATAPVPDPELELPEIKDSVCTEG